MEGPISLNFDKHVQPPEYPFQGVWFPVRIFLQQSDGEPKCGVDLAVRLRLYYPQNQTLAPEGLLEVQGASEDDVITIKKENGSCDANVRILACSMDYENRAFVLCADAVDAETALGQKVAQAATGAMKVMRHRLTIDESKLSWEDTWFKDEGGRDKCIELPLRLVDAQNQLVTHRKQLKLKVTLLYSETLLAVTDQTILKLFPPHGASASSSSQNLNSSDAYDALVVEDGVAVVRLRIEDVSKNHQGQNFKIKVGPDCAASPMDCDVAHALTQAVTVRSKRNKRRQLASGSRATAAPPRLMPTIAHSPQLASSGTNFAVPPPQPLPASIVAQAAAYTGGPSSSSSSGQDAEQCRAALQAANQWISSALEALHQMEWRLVGYETRDGDAADPSKPLYAIVNPNEHIHRLIRAYNFGVAPHANAAVVDESDDPKRQRTNGGYQASALAASSNDARRGSFAPPPPAEEDPLSPPRLSRERTSVNAVMQVIGDEPPRLERFSTTTLFPEDDDLHHKRPSIAVPPVGGGGDDAEQRPAKQQRLLDTSAAAATSKSLEKPTLLRGVSSLYVGDQGSPSERLVTTTSNPPQPDMAETMVRSVIAKRFKPPRPDAAALGFPAFDADKRLVGLYREIQDNSNGSTHIVFVAASDPDSGLEDGDADVARRAYDREVDSKSDSLHDLARHGNLERLKENVMIYHWSKEAFANDIDSKDLANNNGKKEAPAAAQADEHSSASSPQKKAPAGVLSSS